MLLVGMVLELGATQTQIQRILQSKAFRTSEVQRNLLSYLAEKSLEGVADGLKEYTVGLDVFAKPASYDPRQESTVRMHVARLRQKLAEYYRTEGVDDPILLELPKGGFKVTFEPRVTEAPAPAENAWLSSRAVHIQIALAAALLIAVGLAAYFATEWWRAERGTKPIVAAASSAPWTPELKQLWSPLLSSSRPLMVCLSTPSYGTASGAFLLGQFLGQFLTEHKQEVQLTPSDQLSMPEIAMGNVVFVGAGARDRPLPAIPMDQQIVLDPKGVRNLSPRPGEPTFLADDIPSDPQDVEETYALITHVPGLYGNGEVLYFSGNHIASVVGAVQAFTAPAFARTLVSKLKTPAGTLPRYYQIVLKVRSMDDMPFDISYEFSRDLGSVKLPQAAAGER
jgi:hypothetical protein